MTETSLVSLLEMQEQLTVGALGREPELGFCLYESLDISE